MKFYLQKIEKLFSACDFNPIFVSFIFIIISVQNVATTYITNSSEEIPSSTLSTPNPLPLNSTPTETITNLPSTPEFPNNTNTESSSSTTPTEETTTTESEEERQRQKYIGTPNDIILEHTDFVTLRLRHLLNQTSSSITELRELQRAEFNKTPSYQDAWESAAQFYNQSKKALIEETFAKSPIITGAPPEYHIALIAYTGSFYYDFNAKTRQLCSGFDIDNYEYKSFFKLLELAIDVLGPEISHFNLRNDNNVTTVHEEKVLYRGVGKLFALKIGQKLAFQHFISTSRNPNVADGFSWGKGTTVFEIHAERGKPLGHGVYLGIHSFYSSEEEVLLSPLQVFQVEAISKITNNETGTGVVHVKLQTNSYLPPVPTPSQEEECKSLLGLKDYMSRLKLAVAIMGAVLVTLLLGGGSISLYMLLTRRKFCYKTRTVSELQLM